MNDAQKLDEILNKVNNPAPATVDADVLKAAVADAVTAALKPITDTLATIAAGVADIQGEVDEPAAAAGSAAGSTAAGGA